MFTKELQSPLLKYMHIVSTVLVHDLTNQEVVNISYYISYFLIILMTKYLISPYLFIRTVFIQVVHMGKKIFDKSCLFVYKVFIYTLFLAHLGLRA